MKKCLPGFNSSEQALLLKRTQRLQQMVTPAFSRFFIQRQIYSQQSPGKRGY